jgi:hypothetical protein
MAAFRKILAIVITIIIFFGGIALSIWDYSLTMPYTYADNVAYHSIDEFYKQLETLPLENIKSISITIKHDLPSNLNKEYVYLHYEIKTANNKIDLPFTKAQQSGWASLGVLLGAWAIGLFLAVWIYP